MKQAERLATSKDDLALIYNRLGIIYKSKGNLDNALLYHSRHLSLSREFGDKKGEAIALNNIAIIYEKTGELDKALDYYEQSLRLQRDEKEKATTYNNIALIYYKKGDYEKAIRYLKDAIEIGMRAGNYHGVARWMLNLGDTYREAKDFSRAEETLREGLTRILKIGDKYWEAAAYQYFGWLYQDMGNIKLARDYFTKAYELFNSIGAKANAEDVLFSLLGLDLQKKRDLYAGIEIGSKGVKAMVIELMPADEEGFYNVDERLRRSINTTIISGVAEIGLFQKEAIEETARAVKELFDLALKEGVKSEDVFIVGSSAFYKAKNRDELSEKIAELTGHKMDFVDKKGEVFYNIIGSIPQKHRTKALLIDIGSGNTKIGYLEEEQSKTVSVEIPYGTVSFAEKAKEGKLSTTAYISHLSKLSQTEVSQRLKQEVSRKPSLVNRRPVFMVGGIVWAMVTILYPEKQDSFLRIKTEDINRFYNLVTKKKDAIFDIDLSKIKDESIKKKAEKQLQSVKDVFSVDNLIAGATILKVISEDLKLKGKEIYFARNGSWLWGYIALTGIEKAEEVGKK